ncbi:MAG: DUF4199 domain-containing protein [Cyclobacteriaceae bacterium]
MNLLVKVSVRYGLLAGIFGCVLIFGFYYLGPHPFVIPVYMDFRIILFALFIFFALREIRDYYQNGVLYFWQGIFTSFLFTITYAALSSLILVLFMRIEPAFLTDYIRLSIQQLKSLPPEVIERIGNEVYNRNLELLPATNTFDLGFLYFSQSFMISLFISIILSVILRRQPKT